MLSGHIVQILVAIPGPPPLLRCPSNRSVGITVCIYSKVGIAGVMVLACLVNVIDGLARAPGAAKSRPKEASRCLGVGRF